MKTTEVDMVRMSWISAIETQEWSSIVPSEVTLSEHKFTFLQALVQASKALGLPSLEPIDLYLHPSLRALVVNLPGFYSMVSPWVLLRDLPDRSVVGVLSGIWRVRYDDTVVPNSHALMVLRESSVIIKVKPELSAEYLR
jgi:hypothetical protein